MRLAAIAIAAVALVACSDDDGEVAADQEVASTTEAEAETTTEAGGPRLIVEPDDDSTGGYASARFVGEVLAEECVVLLDPDGVEYVAVWPEGTTLTEDGVRMGDRLLRFGEEATLGGGEATEAEHLAQLGADDCGLDRAWIVSPS